MIKRVMVAITTPFRMILVQIQKLFNINILSAKLIKPLTTNVRKLITLKPSSKDDYISIGPFWVYKKIFAFLVLCACAGVFIYFSMFAAKVEEPPQTMTAIKTNITFRYDDIKIKDFTGLANIKAQDGAVVYTGEIVAGVCKGLGTLNSREGYKLYEGQFDRNKYNGIGVAYYPDGKMKYEGGFLDNLYEGQGRQMDRAGNLIYDGSFQAGRFEGEGRLYDVNGMLIYEGQFAAGLRHGIGTAYTNSGIPQYQGGFFEDQYHGEGTLFNRFGKQLYTGLMLNGKINYQSLVGSTLKDVETAFHETPRIYYYDAGASCFVFEDAGVMVSTECRVVVDEWERTQEDISDGYYYMPSEQYSYSGEYYDSTIPADNTGYSGDSLEAMPMRRGGAFKSSASQVLPLYTGRQIPGLTNMSSWQVFDPYTPQEDDDDTIDSDSSSSSSSSSNSTITTQPDQHGSASAPTANNDASSSTSSAPPAQNKQARLDDEMPEFVEKNRTLYFEIDKDIWQSELELDRSKVLIRRVTVLESEAPVMDNTVIEVGDDAPPSVEDCVAIDYIRFRDPTAFSSVTFQMDKQNRLFIRLWNINYASYLERKVYQKDDMIWRYCYSGDGEKIPAYYSIEK